MIRSNTCPQKAFKSVVVITAAFIICFCALPFLEKNLHQGGDDRHVSLENPGFVIPSTTPTLTYPEVSPTSGTITTTFYFYVYYTDSSNHAPSYVRVYIDGAMHTMSKVTSSDVTYYDGCDYYHTATLAAGSHTYYFTTSDVIGYTRTTSTYSGPSVSGGNPITLSSASVSPSSGTTATTYTYEVTYTNSNNYSPSYVRVYIDGISHTMSNLYGDYTYTDGAVYSYSTTLSVRSHTYYFSASDGSYSRSTSTYSGPTVVAVITLTSSVVSPSSGTTATTFTYSITYTNINDLAPTYMKVYIDSKSYTMSKKNPTDNTYTDGCVYVYSNTFSSGSHSYYFSCSDGTSSASTTSQTIQVNVDPTGGIVAVFVIIGFLVVLGVSVSAYKKKHPSTFVPRPARVSRPSPAMEPLSFRPVTQTPIRYEEPVLPRKTEMRALPSPRTKPLSGKMLAEKVNTILTGRNMSGTKFDDAEYQGQLQAFAASFIASWMAPGETAVSLPVVAERVGKSNFIPQQNRAKESSVDNVIENSNDIHKADDSIPKLVETSPASQPVYSNALAMTSDQDIVKELESELVSIIKKEPGSDEGLDLINSPPNPPNPLGDEPQRPGLEQPASPQDDGGDSDPEKPDNPDGE